MKHYGCYMSWKRSFLPCWTGGYGHALTTEQAKRRCIRLVALGWSFTCRMDYSMDPVEALSESEFSAGFMTRVLELGRVRLLDGLEPDLQWCIDAAV